MGIWDGMFDPYVPGPQSNLGRALRRMAREETIAKQRAEMEEQKEDIERLRAISDEYLIAWARCAR